MPDRQPHRLCAEARALRTKLRLSLTDVETDSGIDAVVVGSWERGDRRPAAERLDELLHTYGHELAIVPIGFDETATHAMTMLHDDGLYRHLRFTSADNQFYWFDLITWPGVLAVRGGVGDGYMFSRVEDMFTFFRGQNVNPHYWAEKITDGRERCSNYSADKFRAAVDEVVADHEANFPGLREAVEAALTDDYNAEYRECAEEFLRDFRYTTDEGAEEIASARAVWSRTHSVDDWKIFQQVESRNTFQFADWQDWDLTDWTWQYLWACHAIVWGIARYDAARTAEAVAA